MTYLSACKGTIKSFDPFRGKTTLYRCNQLIITTAPVEVHACTTCQPGNKWPPVLFA